ncbi:Zinc finger CCHC domain-containing protein 7 [Frankliniella fusca]|uniref:Zinc finger CCHC domain-containing protein 7 n=1 Tax=Frankliniella fusca TaxID=407009 RepID=A0AAE1LHS2_9NEOP|nr:Zinc finger CCHC domain-containing protein 7 [Frankliniella fusca]
MFQGMDFVKEEANLVYEERLGGSKSPDHHEESDEEEKQRELEEMLYSRVYYDDSSIQAASPEDAMSLPAPAIIHNIEASTLAGQLGFASSGIDEPTTSMGSLQMQAGCNRSQFNHPNRFKASRYYDNDGNKNSKLTFVAPCNPSLKYNEKTSFKDPSFTRPSEFTTRLMTRSANERSYKPRVTKSNTTDKEYSGVVLKDKPSHLRSSQIPSPEVLKRKTVAVVDSFGKPSVTRQSPQSFSSSSLETSLDSDHSKECIASDKSSPNTSDTIKELTSGLEKGKSDASDEVKNMKIVSPRKKSCNQLSENSPRTRKLKQQSFEAKVSKVLSSMLDDESRSSIDETPVVSSNQNLDNLNSDSSWSVGMSWADMSSKFSFGVDSIEEESVRSLQLQDDSSNANSRTHTPDIQERLAEPEKDAEPTEPSKYQLQLKVSDMEAKIGQSDSESEVGSVVEVAPPVKPPPPLVDLSDGEFVPIIKENKKSLPVTKDITVLFNKQINTSDSCADFVVESSSDDDLVMLDVIDNSKQNNSSRSQRRESRGVGKRRSLESSLSKDTVPIKRFAGSQRPDKTEESTNEEQISEDCREFVDQPVISKEINAMKRLDQWLHNPIQSSKYLDHKRFLKKMSDDPKLWPMCSADINNYRSSNRGPKCVNCNDFGHKAKFCPAPRKLVVCHMCGAPGHSEPRCPKKMCLRCGEKNNIYTDRCKKCVSLLPCKVCESTLHDWKSCPDLWRRYHLTTSLGGICKAESVDIRPRNELWCSNCAGKYHLSHECKRAQWKCESISPFIRSYAEIGDEQQIIEGPTTMTMLLTDDCASVLASSEGKRFLDELATSCKVIIRTNFDVKFKKIVLEGISLNLQETREKIIEWSQKQKAALAEKNVQKNIASPKLPPHLCPKLPYERDSLAIVLANQLQLLETPGVIDQTVTELYKSVQKKTEELSNKSTKKEIRDERSKCYRFLNMILVGKCGFSGGKSHVNALKSLLSKLEEKKCPAVCGKVLYKKIQKHFNPIFSNCCRSDYEQLLNRFYKTDDLVKKYDHQEDRSKSNEVSISKEDKSRNNETSFSEEAKNGNDELSASEVKRSSRKKTDNKKVLALAGTSSEAPEDSGEPTSTTDTTTPVLSTTASVGMEAGRSAEPLEAHGEDESWLCDPDHLAREDMDACFTAFDKDGDGYLDLKEFGSVCRALFRNDKGKIYSLEPKQLYEIFNIFDRNKNFISPKISVSLKVGLVLAF